MNIIISPLYIKKNSTTTMFNNFHYFLQINNSKVDKAPASHSGKRHTAHEMQRYYWPSPLLLPSERSCLGYLFIYSIFIAVRDVCHHSL